ncbi:MFS transporter [Prosthecobacter sp.]|uniref:MFS transporter n=1 Tax=Prosthecobacter sp. TaxID=1965333 RepID=UPI002ABB2067|nr:MFS transporter [Prosthecobacter sp.]MDZ4402649.1 MFS transporter [Prosthecobacter sp.]
MSADSLSTSRAADTAPLPRAWLIVGLLWVVGCLNYLDRVLLTTMRDSIKAAIPMGDDDFGALTMAFLIVYGLLSPLGGWCADRFSRSGVILVSLAVWSTVTWATAYVQTYNQLLATRVLMGVSEACYIPAALALIADYHRGSTRSLATGINISGVYAGMALGGLGGWMADTHGWSSGFLVFGVFGVAYAVVLAAFLRDVPRVQNEDNVVETVPLFQTLAVLGRNRQLWLLTLHWSLLGFAGWAFVTWMPSYLREHFDLTQTKAGFTATAYMQAAALAGVLCGGVLADRWSRRHPRGRIFVPMIALTLASPFVFISANSDTLWIVAACLVVFGFARGCSDSNMMPILCQVADPRHRATGYGILNFIACLVGAVAAYLGGWLKERNVDLSYILMASAFGVLLSGVLLAAVRPARSE